MTEATIVPRPSVNQRAGTVLDHRFTLKIYGQAKQNLSVHGVLDTSQRVYQSGGELDNFVYWRMRWVTMEYGVWEQIRDKADWIEMIDHQSNRCYRISTDFFGKFGQQYNAGLRLRIGVPIENFEILEPGQVPGTVAAKSTDSAPAAQQVPAAAAKAKKAAAKKAENMRDGWQQDDMFYVATQRSAEAE